jgi:plasminogen activator inhibitor 1 RNA-binding protein
VDEDDETEEGAAVLAPTEEPSDDVPDALQPEPVVDNTISYEEYMASKAVATASGLLAPVKEREIVDEFANVKPAAKDEQEDFLVMGGAKQKRKKEAKPTKTATELLAGLRVASGDNTASSSGGRGGRDGRGRGRGRDGEGGRGRGRDGEGGRGRGREGRGRGGRDGGGRGGRGRGGGREGGRGGRGGGVNVQDESAFPSL